MISCKNKPDVKNFPLVEWKQDTWGCVGKRKALLNSFEELKPQLIGILESDFISMFGNPDSKILEERGKKQYLYYLASENCDKEVLFSEIIVVEIDALNRISLITYITK